MKVVVGAYSACPQSETNANFILLLDENGVFHHFLNFTEFLPPFLSMSFKVVGFATSDYSQMLLRLNQNNGGMCRLAHWRNHRY